CSARSSKPGSTNRSPRQPRRADLLALPAARPVRRRVPALRGGGVVQTTPPAGVKAAEGGRGESRDFSLDARVSGGRSPPDKPPRPLGRLRDRSRSALQ